MAAVAGQVLAQRDDFVGQLFAMTRAEIRVLDEEPRIRALLEASITENIVAAVHFLQHGTDVEDLEAPTAALTYARTLAQRDVPLSALIRAYRFGHSRFLDVALMLLDSADVDDQMAAVLRLVQRSAAYIDTVCELVGRAYETERDRWVGSRGGLRQQVVNEVLEGATVDLARAETTLGYAFDRVHVAMEVWPAVDVPVFDVVQLFDEVRRVVAAVLRVDADPLVVPVDEREARMWFALGQSGRGRVDPVEAPQVAAALADAGLAVHLAAGEPERGVAGFRATARQAGQVKAITSLGAAGLPRVVTYRDVAPVALMAGDLPALRAFVARTLGALAGDDERCATLRETLRVFLDRHRSQAAAAEVLVLHRNSVQYRVQQALDLCQPGPGPPGRRPRAAVGARRGSVVRPGRPARLSRRRGCAQSTTVRSSFVGLPYGVGHIHRHSLLGRQADHRRSTRPAGMPRRAERPRPRVDLDEPGRIAWDSSRPTCRISTTPSGAGAHVASGCRR